MLRESLDQKDLELIDKFPQIKIPNRFFRNEGDMQFEDLNGRIQNDKKTYSNGAVYADFDNDGDLDILVNNIDEPAYLYENLNERKGGSHFTEIKLKGPSLNVNALGSKVILYVGKEIRIYENILCGVFFRVRKFRYISD